jgi:hypothetical protein
VVGPQAHRQDTASVGVPIDGDPSVSSAANGNGLCVSSTRRVPDLIGSAFSPPMFLHNIGKMLDAPDFFDQHRESQPISTASTTVTATSVHTANSITRTPQPQHRQARRSTPPAAPRTAPQRRVGAVCNWPPTKPSRVTPGQSREIIRADAAEWRWHRAMAMSAERHRVLEILGGSSLGCTEAMSSPGERRHPSAGEVGGL